MQWVAVLFTVDSRFNLSVIKYGDDKVNGMKIVVFGRLINREMERNGIGWHFFLLSHTIYRH